ncbi:MAG: hypothetical protein COV57_03080 [Candidatus Liptonbacteria bacterium CG11_big_fil_rev_8_21_14_0_20_35_14]|uniref:Uncharacterized protein n=1 Tax=Candidatus Liptonbacteria bacterium CG11_big_fil_rev_8_21_14_0_20_35_14 TaxID=1974634 RepID=A0A2H0N701_9BACT|nr:MAG: hypothetical protein COV57_03080 [Candidatus Liptonbacteria bacterium CG11_big_fil_rev_8_21_14_0_20_35_14]PJB52561.1 MAG: hypothetical protein CO099_11905 [Bdellovibrio sp. CG_4_9_14_3_um_filter_39_7]
MREFRLAISFTLLIFMIFCANKAFAFEEDRLIGIHKSVEINDKNSTVLILPELPLSVNCIPSDLLGFNTLKKSIESGMSPSKASMIDNMASETIDRALEVYPRKKVGKSNCSFLLKGGETFSVELVLNSSSSTPTINFKKNISKVMENQNNERLEVFRQFLKMGKPQGFIDITPSESKNLSKKTKSGLYTLKMALSDLKENRLFIFKFESDQKELLIDVKKIDQVFLSAEVVHKGSRYLYVSTNISLKMNDLLMMFP